MQVQDDDKEEDEGEDRIVIRTPSGHSDGCYPLDFTKSQNQMAT